LGHTYFGSQLVELYVEQKKIRPNDYLEAHSHNSAVIRRDTSIFERYSKYIPENGSILDWGCNHAPTACMVRMLRGDSVKIHGCDVHEQGYEAFFEFSGLDYTRLDHPYRMPYEDNFFDAVTGTAVLEHVPNDSRSLEELYRVIKPGGVFIMTTPPTGSHTPNGSTGR
jgi:ubiquinone/menaquinone biosynthesis C-methylase UbiE